VTVGETLTEARSQAGLSVDELSERTKIRGTVIRSIEQDDYEACGGDLYARGYVRAIAGAVGIDAQPLIREFDLGRFGGPNERANGSTGRHARGYPTVALPEAAPTSFDLPAIPAVPPARDEPAPPADLNATRYDMPPVGADPAATSYDLPRVPEGGPTAELPAAEFPVSVPPPPVPSAAVPPGAAETRYDLTAVPGDLVPAAPTDLMAAGYDLGSAGAPADADSRTRIIPAIGFNQAAAETTTAWPAPGQGGPGQVGAAPGRSARKKRRGPFAVAAAVIVVVAAGALGIYFATGGTATENTAATSVPSPNASAAAAKASASAAAQAKASASAQASVSAAAQASAPASAKAKAKAKAKANADAGAQRVISLAVASVMAFGPGGSADGDDPGDAKDAIAANPSQPWATQWYSTAAFGMLKHGTGLLLDLGGKVAVTTVRLDLSRYQGADLQLRVGDGEALQDLKVAATANNVSGALKLTLSHPSAARYLLIWITQLPPDGAGHYQETVSHVTVTGRRAG
jgi:cytoskeletal protein RodZ